jgi:hypothetical protein
MLKRTIAMLLALPLTLTALVMLFAPVAWYDAFPGVSETGPLNTHFVRDLGCTNLVVAGILWTYGCSRHVPLSALVAAATFMALHALLHVSELIAMPADAGVRLFIRDLPGVYLPGLLISWFALDAAIQVCNGPTSSTS